MRERRWFLKKTNAEYVSHLSHAANVSPIVAQILINRGITDAGLARGFLSRTPNPMCDPFILTGMRESADAIALAVSRGTRIFVHGDYDADGLTSTAIMVGGLRAMGADVIYFIPNRFKDGYGFNPPSVQRARESSCGMIITVDCGISAFEAVAAANRAGIEVVVTDHHEPVLDPSSGRPELPAALAIVNPKLMGADGPELSGAGVALKLIEALSQSDARIDPDLYYDLAALGTLADSVPLVGENRSIVMRGMDDIRSGRRPGLAALRASVGLNDRTLTSTFLNFSIVPRINAAGRLSDSAPVVGLMLSDTQEEAMGLAIELDRLNSERQKIEEGVLKEALARLSADGFENVIVLEGEGWHEGVIGIVASKLVDRFYRPVVILSVNGERARGSSRSIPEFDIYKGLGECAELLGGFGGHKQAAGITMRAGDIAEFRERLNAVVGEAVPEFIPTLGIDAAVSLAEVTTKLIEEIECLAPFGYGNPQPVLGARDLQVASMRVVGNNHLKLRLRHRNHMMDAIGFSMGEMSRELEDVSSVDAAFTVTINEWEGRRSPQLHLKAIRECGG